MPGSRPSFGGSLDPLFPVQSPPAALVAAPRSEGSERCATSVQVLVRCDRAAATPAAASPAAQANGVTRRSSGTASSRRSSSSDEEEEEEEEDDEEQEGRPPIRGPSESTPSTARTELGVSR